MGSDDKLATLSFDMTWSAVIHGDKWKAAPVAHKSRGQLPSNTFVPFIPLLVEANFKSTKSRPKNGKLI